MRCSFRKVYNIESLLQHRYYLMYQKLVIKHETSCSELRISKKLNKQFCDSFHLPTELPFHLSSSCTTSTCIYTKGIPMYWQLWGLSKLQIQWLNVLHSRDADYGLFQFHGFQRPPTLRCGFRRPRRQAIAVQSPDPFKSLSSVPPHVVIGNN